MNHHEPLIQFIINIPELRDRYGDVVPLDRGGANSLIFAAAHGRQRVILKFDSPTSNHYRRLAFTREYNLLDELRGVDGIIQLIGNMEEISYEVQVPGSQVTLPYVLTYFPMEAARIDLAEMIQSGKKDLTMMQVLTLFRGVTRAVRRLHNYKICHRDIKPGNFFVFPSYQVKVGDLGCARKLGEPSTSLLDVYDLPRGDISYTAPELLCVVRECDDGFLDGDFYSLGTVLFEMVTGEVYGNYVYGFENLWELTQTFRIIPPTSKEYVFGKLLPTIVESHPPPKLTQLRPDIPKSIELRLERLYRNLTEPYFEKRLHNFESIFAQLQIMTMRLRMDEKLRAQQMRK